MKTLGQGSNPWGRTMTKEEEKLQQEQQNYKTLIFNCAQSIQLCRQIYNFAVQNDFHNTQGFMDWQDALNEISVRYPDIIDITPKEDIQNNKLNENEK